MVKSSPLGVRVAPEVKEALERAAQIDMRTLSSMIEKILVEYLRERKLLDAPKAMPRRRVV